MQNNLQCFSLRRLVLFMKVDIVLNRSTIITAAATIAGLLLFYNLVSAHNIINVEQNPGGFLMLLFIGGIWVTSLAFQDLHDSEKNYFFLTLPCSQAEKFLARLLLTSIVYALAVLVFYTLFYWILAAYFFVVIHGNYFISTPFMLETWRHIIHYIMLQALFLLGAVYFKKNAILKTIFALCCFGIIFFLFSSVVFGVFVRSLFVGGNVWMPHFANLSPFAKDVLQLIGMLIAPLCWYVTYLRIKETEV